MTRIVLVPERHVERSAGSGYLDIRSNHRFASADRRPHGLPEHRVDACPAVLHFPGNANDSAFAI
jgi:hypothetical protein